MAVIVVTDNDERLSITPEEISPPRQPEEGQEEVEVKGNVKSNYYSCPVGTTQVIIHESFNFIHHFVSLSTESFSIFLDEAMKKGYVEVKLVKVIVVGPAGVGKTCLIYLLLSKPPPDKRHSTGCAERSIRVIRIGKEGEEWSEISTEEFHEDDCRGSSHPV